MIVFYHFSKSSNSKKKNNLKKSSQKSKKKGGAGTGNQVTDKLFNVLEKHKEVFFTIRLVQPQAEMLANNKQIVDPDPLIASELMDGRDTFLNRAREEHWEFSSLRRAKYSTMNFCYALHTQEQDNKDMSYTCNRCNNGASYHCPQCDVRIFSNFHFYILPLNLFRYRFVEIFLERNFSIFLFVGLRFVFAML